MLSYAHVGQLYASLSVCVYLRCDACFGGTESSVSGRHCRVLSLCLYLFRGIRLKYLIIHKYMSISYFTRWINGAELFVNKPRCSQALYQCWRLWCTETFYGAKDTLWSASSHPINMYTDINAEMVISMKSTYSKKVIRDIETEQLFRLLVCQCPADTTRQCESVASVREGSILILRIHHKSKTSRMERLELLLPYIFFLSL